MLEAGIPYTQFTVKNLAEEFKRLSNLRVVFTMKPTETGNVNIAILNDECGNLIQLVEE